MMICFAGQLMRRPRHPFDDNQSGGTKQPMEDVMEVDKQSQLVNMTQA